ncbi:membrane-bound lytic murein transglycosylase B [Sinobacterium caligoides]|uniref:Membrane-bound lytic murein transglycosylase B n=1 Tax=Sinobacterium caligoides TaxID=933926 RepID=A0A3N2DNR4_9GAMM|nr:lytic murein transglycosylase [Sinobacterium caligoides]ROS00965.1 membrane-bound lytic murein transglycosylase B [Sinobacterium caligoides]
MFVKVLPSKILTALGSTALLLASAGTVLANDNFASCIDQYSQRAAHEGYSAELIDATLGKAKHVERVIKLDKKQPEFTQSFNGYLYGRVNNTRLTKGIDLYREHRKLLSELTVRYGVPGQYIIAFWGLETNYGGYLGKMPIIDSLATLACNPRRSRYFGDELMQALKLMDKFNIPPEQMRGSWAGAMGNTQFMPSAYVNYGVDGDGDGKVDLWNSVPDALTSAANFLNGLGWQPQQPWGREVLLPKDFDYRLAGRKYARSVEQWSKLGLTMSNGKALSDTELQAFLIVPASHTGPAFLLYKNFDIIMKWNRSEFYALSVGHMADRIVGGGDLVHPPAKDAVIKISAIEALQRKLTTKGFDTNGIDGVMGPGTRKAVRNYQASVGLIADGFPDKAVFERLGIKLD